MDERASDLKSILYCGNISEEVNLLIAPKNELFLKFNLSQFHTLSLSRPKDQQKEEEVNSTVDETTSTKACIAQSKTNCSRD
jgi:hypothetical protein